MACNRDRLLSLLDLARWAPSGDNTQPWRFEIVGDDTIRIHGHDTRDEVVYDFDGHPSHMAHGALLETMAIAASGDGMRLAECRVDSAPPHRSPIYTARFVADAGRQDPLFECITRRTVQRRPMRRTPLGYRQRDMLAAAANALALPVDGPAFHVRFFEGRTRRGVAKLLWDSAHFRLTSPEAYAVHCQVIDWKQRFSNDRIPEEAVGVDPATARLMHWIMKRWSRVVFFNRFLFGTVMPRLQLDVLPALYCAAHILVRPEQAPTGIADWLRLGASLQRTWLTATHLGLHLQPELTPLILRWYAQTDRNFSSIADHRSRARAVSEQLDRLAGTQAGDVLGFLCRVGISSPVRSRSLRRDVSELMHTGGKA
jgi:hypothetical protein